MTGSRSWLALDGVKKNCGGACTATGAWAAGAAGAGAAGFGTAAMSITKLNLLTLRRGSVK